jgi:hypothetical protein
MFFYIDAGFDDAYSFGFEELFLEGGVGFADEDFAVGTEDPVPGNAFSGRRCAHGATCGARATRETQGFSKGSIGKNPAAGNLFHQLVNGIERHRKSTPCNGFSNGLDASRCKCVPHIVKARVKCNKRNNRRYRVI